MQGTTNNSSCYFCRNLFALKESVVHEKLFTLNYAVDSAKNQLSREANKIVNESKSLLIFTGSEKVIVASKSEGNKKQIDRIEISIE